jgi:hypothetical protein
MNLRFFTYPFFLDWVMGLLTLAFVLAANWKRSEQVNMHIIACNLKSMHTKCLKHSCSFYFNLSVTLCLKMKSEENILYNGRHSGVQTHNEALSTFSKHVQAFVFENIDLKIVNQRINLSSFNWGLRWVSMWIYMKPPFKSSKSWPSMICKNVPLYSTLTQVSNTYDKEFNILV